MDIPEEEILSVEAEAFDARAELLCFGDHEAVLLGVPSCHLLVLNRFDCFLDTDPGRAFFELFHVQVLTGLLNVKERSQTRPDFVFKRSLPLLASGIFILLLLLRIKLNTNIKIIIDHHRVGVLVVVREFAQLAIDDVFLEVLRLRDSLILDHVIFQVVF